MQLFVGLQRQAMHISTYTLYAPSMNLGLYCCVPTVGKGVPAQLDQLKLWKAFLEYERSNPQRLEPGSLTKRVELAYMQALMCLLHFPEVWGVESVVGVCG